MPTTTPLTDAIEALTRYANETTGASDTTLSDAVGTLVAGYGGGGSMGGLANMVNENDPDVTFAFMLSAMKNGNTVGGTITWANAFPNTETLLISTGLTALHGIIIASTEKGILDSIWTQANKFVLLYYESSEDKYYIVSQNNNVWGQKFGQSNGVANNTGPVNGTIRISGGDIYYTARYNGNNNYQIVRSGEPYEWLAW